MASDGVNFDDSYFLLGPSRASTFADSLASAASRWSHTALAFPHERATYPELASRADDLARGLLALGVGAGEKVGVLIAQGVDYFALVFGIAKVGAVAVPINPRFKARELKHVISNSDMTALVASDNLLEMPDPLDMLEEALPSLASAMEPELHLAEAPLLRHIVIDGDSSRDWASDYVSMLEEGGSTSDELVLSRNASVAIRDTAIIMYTSGTTANPKGVMLPHEALVRHGFTIAETRFELTADDRVWSALPLHHIGGMAFFFTCLAAGATYCHTANFDPGRSIEQLQDEGCTIAIPIFETIWLAVLNHPDFEQADFSKLRIIDLIGVAERLAQMQAVLPHAIQVSSYGATESSSWLSMGKVNESLEVRTTTGGHPIPGIHARVVVPDSSEDLPAGELGEIIYRGWSVFTGYYKDPEATAAAFDSEGWFHTGDLGTLDAEGRLTYVSRIKDMLKVGGENVAAAEVEGHLISHPAVLLAQVVGAPDTRYGEVPAAFIQLAPGEPVTDEELTDYCLGSIATFRVPRYFRFVDDWPMSGTKIKKHVLREQIAAELAEAGITEAPKLSSRGNEVGGGG